VLLCGQCSVGLYLMAGCISGKYNWWLVVVSNLVGRLLYLDLYMLGRLSYARLAIYIGLV